MTAPLETAPGRASASRRRLLGHGLALAGGVGLARLGGGRALVVAGAGTFGLAPATRAETPADRIRLRDFYEKDLSFSALAESLAGEVVSVRGFMAPPLKAGSRFFVLTKRPMADCPFCNDASDWPDDIAAVYTKREFRVLPFNVDIVARGRLSLGDERDPETGFFSRLRIVDAVVERL